MFYFIYKETFKTSTDLEFQAHGYKTLGMIGDGATDLEVTIHFKI